MVAITVSPAPRIPRSADGPCVRLVAPRSRPTGLRASHRLVGVAALVLVVALAVAYLLRAPALDTSGAIPVQDTVHVVAEGETMWSIAGAVAPAGEAATYVERLVEVNGSATAVPGQVLELPVP